MKFWKKNLSILVTIFTLKFRPNMFQSTDLKKVVFFKTALFFLKSPFTHIFNVFQNKNELECVISELWRFLR